eukprot:scaffold116_cov165-Amphora_coffeaeformis.AAC.4
MGPARLPRITLRQYESLISSQAVSVSEMASYCRSLAVAGEDIWNLNAFVTIASNDEIEEQAQKSEERWNSGKPLSALDGLPVSIKSNLAVATKPLTAGSAILGGGSAMNETPPVGYTADAVRSLQKSGAIIVGITQMDEFGMGSLGTNVVSGNPTKNPLSFFSERATEEISSLIRLPFEEICSIHAQLASASLEDPVSAGGSSCGSAASVAHGSSLLSLGSDTGGSVRLPAAWCGIVGIRPTYGKISRHGLVSYASSFDTVGILANSSDCVERVFPHVVQCNDPSRDSTITTTDVLPSWQSSDEHSTKPLTGLRVGIPEAFSVAECPTDVQEAWSYSAEQLASKGATVEVIPDSIISAEVLQRSLASYFILVSAEASSNLARYDGFRYGVNAPNSVNDWDKDSMFSLLEHQYARVRTAGFGPEVIRRVLCGTAALSADRFHTHYQGAARLRAELTQQLRSALQDYHVLLVPTVLFAPPSLHTEVDPVEVFANDIMTIPSSLAGLPALSVPLRKDSAARYKPSMQLIGRPFDESVVLRAAAALE